MQNVFYVNSETYGSLEGSSLALNKNTNERRHFCKGLSYH